MFAPRGGLLQLPFLQSKFDVRGLRSQLETVIGDRRLGTPDLVTGFACITKRIDTGSVWTISNNPRSPYWEDGESYIGNKHYSLANLVRASTAAPQYFDPVKSSGVRYSFSGQVRGPREVLDGGYLSWFDPQTRHLFQLQVDGKKKTIADRGEVPFAAESLRALSDRVSADRRDSVIKGGSRAGLRLNAETDYRKRARIEKPKLTAVDHAQVAHARNLWAQLERIAAAE